jgi:hypothetical protein
MNGWSPEHNIELITMISSTILNNYYYIGEERSLHGL